jgi:hypothetical protein
MRGGEALHQLVYVDLHVALSGLHFGLHRGRRRLRLGLRQVARDRGLSLRSASARLVHVVGGHIRRKFVGGDGRCFLSLLFASHLLDHLGQVDLGAELLLSAGERALAGHLRALAAGR